MSIDVSKISADLEKNKQKLPKLIAATADIVLKKLQDVEDGTVDNLKNQLDAAFQARNLTRLAISGIEVDEGKLLKIANDNLVDVKPLGIEPSLIKNLARMIFEGQKRPGPGETVIIAGAKRNIEVLEEIARLCAENEINFVIDIASDEINTILINNSDDEGLERLGQERIDLYAPATTLLAAHSNPTAEYDFSKNTKYQSAQNELRRRIENDLAFSFTLIPTEKDAEIDGIPYEDYIKLFLEACDQPWEAIKQAQERLIQKLNQGKVLKITNKDGTNLDIGIDGFTFVNSGTEENIPGSEVFSAPEKEKINGTLESKGSFKYGTYPVIKDISLKFTNGKITDFDAKEGRETLERILNTDEGAKFIGEIAFGTNPHLRRHFVNSLLVEKISGSFHLAAGLSHKRTSHQGKPVNVNNENESEVHWDITTMLKDGEVLLDEKLIQKNGLWVNEDGTPDPKLAVLNYGWGAMPSEKQPPWWKKRFPNGYED